MMAAVSLLCAMAINIGLSFGLEILYENTGPIDPQIDNFLTNITLTDHMFIKMDILVESFPTGWSSVLAIGNRITLPVVPMIELWSEQNYRGFLVTFYWENKGSPGLRAQGFDTLSGSSDRIGINETYTLEVCYDQTTVTTRLSGGDIDGIYMLTNTRSTGHDNVEQPVYAGFNFPGYQPLDADVIITNLYIGSNADCSEPLDIPTGPVCDEDDFGTFNWDTLTEEGIDIPLFNLTEFDVDESDLSLNIKVELEYLRSVSADHEEETNFGVTYVLDFEDYDAHKDLISEPGTCQNRNESVFNGKSWSDYWTYSDDPANDIGTADYLEYPPPDPVSGSWDVYMKDGDECNTVIYQGKFTWNELRGCEPNGGGDSYTSIDSDDKWLNLTGTFYINVVSPFWYSSDFGYYRVYQLLSQPFVIAVSSTVYVLGSTGINLMTLSVIAVYKEDDASDFKLVLMTETAEYMMLERTDTSIFLFNPADDNDNNFNNTNFEASTDPENSAGCLSNKQFICTQLWEIEASNIGCTVGAGGEGTDFSGSYSLGFNAVCFDTANDSHCSQWIEDHPDLQGEISLTTELSWKDSICDPEVFTVQFVANMIFYSGPISEERSDGSDEYQVIAGSDNLYQVGEDRIYVEIETEFPSDTLEIFNTKLINVWVCTFAPDVTPSIDMDNLLTSGCLSSSRDSQYDEFFYNIYYSGDTENAQSGFTVDNDNEDDEKDIVRFSFDVPNEVARDTLYVHAQIEVELTELEGVRRRMILNVGMDSEANQIQHFGEEIGIKHDRNKEPQIPNNYQYPPQQQPQPQLPLSPQPLAWTITLSSPWFLAIASILAFILTSNILFMCYRNCCDSQRGVGFIDSKGKRGYSEVKTVDSEYDDPQSADSAVPIIEPRVQ